MKPRLSMKLLWKYLSQFNGDDAYGAAAFLEFVEAELKKKQPQEN